MNPLQEYLGEYKMAPQLPYVQFNKISSVIGEEATKRFGLYAADVIALMQPALTKEASADLDVVSDRFDKFERQVNLDIAMMCKAAGVPYDQIKHLPFAEKLAKAGFFARMGRGIKNVGASLIGKGRTVPLPKRLNVGGPTAGGPTAGGPATKAVAKTPAKETTKKVVQSTLKPKAPTTPATVKVQQTPGQTASTGRAEVFKSIQGQSQAAGQQGIHSSAAPGSGPSGFSDTRGGLISPQVSAGSMQANPTLRSAAATPVTKPMVSKGPAAKVQAQPKQPAPTQPAPAQQAPATTQTAPVSAHPDGKVQAIVGENPELAKMMQPGGAAAPTDILRTGGNLSAGQQQTLLNTHASNLKTQLKAGGLNSAEAKGLQNSLTETNNMVAQLGNTGKPIQQGMMGGYGAFGGKTPTGDIVKKLRWPAAGVGAVYLGSQAMGGGQQYSPQGY